MHAEKKFSEITLKRSFIEVNNKHGVKERINKKIISRPPLPSKMAARKIHSRSDYKRFTHYIKNEPDTKISIILSHVRIKRIGEKKSFGSLTIITTPVRSPYSDRREYFVPANTFIKNGLRQRAQRYAWNVIQSIRFPFHRQKIIAIKRIKNYLSYSLKAARIEKHVHQKWKHLMEILSTPLRLKKKENSWQNKIHASYFKIS